MENILSQNATLKPQFEFEKYGINIGELINGPAMLAQQAIDQQQSKELFIVKTGDLWMQEAKELIIPQMLFGEFWFEGEICILFADTNVGKSILAVQIANSIANGRQIPGFTLQAEKQRVLYFDFELNAKQFETRYSCNYAEHYVFGENFKRVQINANADIPEDVSFEDYLIQALERCVIGQNARVLIIDNITYLKNETEKAKDALPLMKQLKALKERYSLSLLVLGHTPKRDTSKVLNRNDALGSKMLMAFCDSSFTIGESNSGNSLRYLKQIKSRNTALQYHENNVCICTINKPYNFLQFELTGFGKEREHLKEPNKEIDREAKVAEAIELKQQGLSNVDIAKQLQLSEAWVRKWLTKHNPGTTG